MKKELIEQWGSGIKAMNTLVKQAGLPEPIYEEIGSNFVVTFRKTAGDKKTIEKTAIISKFLYLTIQKNWF